MAGLKNDVRRLLQLTFPELEHRCKLFTETMLRFLMKFPSASTLQWGDDLGVDDYRKK